MLIFETIVSVDRPPLVLQVVPSPKCRTDGGN